MAEEDDINSFFTEIQSIEETVTASGGIYIPAEEISKPVAAVSSSAPYEDDDSQPRKRIATEAPASQQLMVSAPQVISKSAAVHKPPLMQSGPAYPPPSSLFSAGGGSYHSGYSQYGRADTTVKTDTNSFQSSSYYPTEGPDGYAAATAASATAVSQPQYLQTKKFVRAGANEVWVDKTLNEWPENDFRLFVGDLGNEVTSEMLAKEFQIKFPSFVKAKVMNKCLAPDTNIYKCTKTKSFS